MYNRSKENDNLNQIGYFGNPTVVHTELDNSVMYLLGFVKTSKSQS